ncbi:hypothetical protein HMPREF1155_0533 [Slackia sp. CM382]|nr:hypothetical protein HMPREF1155_0533 [Slackia sp. CM382]
MIPHGTPLSLNRIRTGADVPFAGQEENALVQHLCSSGGISPQPLARSFRTHSFIASDATIAQTENRRP